MKVISEKFDNYPDLKDTTTVLDAVESQAVEDEEMLDKRKEKVQKEISKPLKGKKVFTGRDEKCNPEPANVPDGLKLDEGLFRQLNENINPDDSSRIIHEVIKNSFGVDVEVHSFKDSPSMTVVSEIIVPSLDNAKMVYDELKEKLYKRFNNLVDISCKTFSSTNLRQRTTEYKIKIFVLKEKDEKEKAADQKDIRQYKMFPKGGAESNVSADSDEKKK